MGLARGGVSADGTHIGQVWPAEWASVMPSGAALDVVLLGQPWGFSLGEIQPEVHLWQGEADTLVPPAMGKYLAAQIPRCHAALTGHPRRPRPQSRRPEPPVLRGTGPVNAGYSGLTREACELDLPG